MPPYYSLDALVGMIDEPNRSICQRMLEEHSERFKQAPGSGYNHQAWTGGYWDHIQEAMNIFANVLFAGFESTGRLAQLAPEQQFTLSDGLLVLFLHDIEKPWGYVLVDGKPVSDGHGRLRRLPTMPDKAAKKAFAVAKIAEWGFVLTDQQLNALKYVEGIRDEDYSPYHRRMNELAALCHAADMLSARLLHEFPLPTGDAWGAVRAAG